MNVLALRELWGAGHAQPAREGIYYLTSLLIN